MYAKKIKKKINFKKSEIILKEYILYIIYKNIKNLI